MTSELRVDKIHNEGGDNDSGLDMSTNDVVSVKIAGAEKARVHSDGNVGVGVTPVTLLHVHEASTDDAEIHMTNTSSGATASDGLTIFANEGSAGILYRENSPFRLFTNGSERMRLDNGGNVFIGATAEFIDANDSSTDYGVQLHPDGIVMVARWDGIPMIVGRNASDGTLVQFRQAASTEGTVSVSGSTVSYNGFSGLHESSGIASNTPVGTVCSTIDELDTYPDKQEDTDGISKDHPKKGQNRADHAKSKVSDSAGDKRVYGVLQRFDNGKPMIASVGIGSIRVTGACAGGDLLESNGDGTAKVQSDDIVKSKTIGKVTIGNSNTGVKLVSCVLYCG